jgi:hypothetical protein
LALLGFALHLLTLVPCECLYEMFHQVILGNLDNAVGIQVLRGGRSRLIIGVQKNSTLALSPQICVCDSDLSAIYDSFVSVRS